MHVTKGYRKGIGRASSRRAVPLQRLAGEVGHARAATFSAQQLLLLSPTMCLSEHAAVLGAIAVDAQQLPKPAQSSSGFAGVVSWTVGCELRRCCFAIACCTNETWGLQYVHVGFDATCRSWHATCCAIAELALHVWVLQGCLRAEH